MNYKNYFKQRLFENILSEERPLIFPGSMPSILPQLIDPVKPVTPTQPIDPNSPRPPRPQPKPPNTPNTNPPNTPNTNPDGDEFIPTPQPRDPPTYGRPRGFGGRFRLPR